MRSHSQPEGRTCLTEEVLSDFRAGRLLDADSEGRVADHLASCESCASRLSKLPHDPLSELLRAADPLRPLIEAGQLGPIQATDSTQAHQLSDSVPASPPAKPYRPRPAEELPVKLGDYFVVRELGGGSFGQVYLARDPLHQRLVALKVPRTDRFPTAESRELFLREARTVAELDHPAIVPMYDVGELPDGRCLLALKYIEGTTLQGLMRSERVAPQRAAEIVARIADALDYAHRRQPGVWHRDVKPANILLDRSGLAYLTDFGLALQEDRQQQYAGQLAGTYPYMSPEQILARTEHLDGRSDIWGLGVILYELLTRQRPFRGTTYDELKQEIPQRPHRPARSVEPTIPRRLEAICERCLRKDANERYATAAELARDLRGAVGTRGVARRTWSTGLAVGAAACGLLAVALATGRPWRADPAQRPLDSAAASSARPGADAGRPGTGPPGAGSAPPPALAVERSAPLQRTGKWQPLLNREPAPVAWSRLGDNVFHPDLLGERLTMSHAVDRGLLSYGDLPTANFRLRYLIAIEDWRGSAGNFWGLQQDRSTFPRKEFQCLAVSFQKDTGKRQLAVRFDRFRFVPSQLDNTQLTCIGSEEIAHGTSELPTETTFAVELAVDRGQLTHLLVNEAPLALQWEVDPPGLGVEAPAGHGFFALNARLTVLNASLEILR